MSREADPAWTFASGNTTCRGSTLESSTSDPGLFRAGNELKKRKWPASRFVFPAT